VDYTGLAPQQKGCVNSGYYGGGVTTARVAFKYLIMPNEPANEGIFRPLKLVLPEGTILSADPSAPMGNYSMPFPSVIDVVIRALGKAVPGLATGGHFATHSGFRLYGRWPDGTPFNGHDSGHGGWGASARGDGAGPFRTMAHGDTRLIPLELQESILPIRIQEFTLRQDSAGAGRYRGGLGFRKVYDITADCLLQTNLDRTKCAPWGAAGGNDALPGRVTVHHKGGGEPVIMCKAKGYRLAAGDRVVLETGGGGGYGPPRERARAAVTRDLARGYISREAAARDYGFKD
jgi:N-methylhydantoinase B